MSERIPAHQLQPGMMVQVHCTVEGIKTLARVRKVRGNRLEGLSIDLYTHKALRAPDVPYRSNWWTLSPGFDDPVLVSHLPSESPEVKSASHERGARSEAEAT